MEPRFPIFAPGQIISTDFKTPDQEFWETIFKTVVAASGDESLYLAEDAAKYSDEALEEWRKRWPPHQVETPQLPPFPLMKPPGPTLDNLVYAQKELEAARDRLASMARLRDEMPQEFAEAWWGVEGVPCEKRVEDAEQWVKNIQEQMEKNADPAPPGKGKRANPRRPRSGGVE